MSRYGIVLLVVSAASFFLCAQGAKEALADETLRPRFRGHMTFNRRARDLVQPDQWPAEPKSPAFDKIDESRFADSLRQLCGWMPKGRSSSMARAILSAAKAHEIDAFLLGALAHRLGRCRPKAEAMHGYGYTLVPPRIARRHLSKPSLFLFSEENTADVEDRTNTTIDLGKHRFRKHRLFRASTNFYLAAVLLRMWKEQHLHVDQQFEQHPHRHYVSHYVWGDPVKSDRSEDRILLSRRLFLQHYGAYTPKLEARYLGFRLRPPLDGGLRVISSGLGEERKGGTRHHRGIDFESDRGELVRAVAGGRVNFSGVDLPGRRAHKNMSPSDIAEYDGEYGSGGNYVCVLHRKNSKWLRSCYMHLDEVRVSYGDRIEAGQAIGTVGRSGMKRSSPHLHFELHTKDELLDPAKVLSKVTLGAVSKE